MIKYYSSKIRQCSTIVLVFSLILFALPPYSSAVPNSFIYNGILADITGLPRTGNFTLTFRIYPDSTGSNSLWTETIDITTDSDGRFSVNLGQTTLFGSSLFDGSIRYLALQLDGFDEMLPRQLIGSVPYALNANTGVIQPSNVVGTAAVLDSNQIFRGNNEFTGRTEFNSGELTVASAITSNSRGGPGFLTKTTSDNFPALMALTGIDQDTLLSEHQGGGPIIEGWISYWQVSPPMAIYERRFVVENNGDVKADGAFYSGGADFAEMFNSDDLLAPGDLVVIDESGNLQVHASTTARSKNVIGIVSTQPGFIGGGVENSAFNISIWDRDQSYNSSAGQNKVAVAITGIVPCKVTDENGPINPGDLLVSSSLSGYAMKATNPEPGTVIAKALTSHTTGQGVIKVLVMLR